MATDASSNLLNQKPKDSVLVWSIVIQGLAVFLVSLGLSFFYPEIGLAVFLAGSASVLPNVVFALLARRTDSFPRILTYYMGRFLLIIVCTAAVIVWLKQTPVWLEKTPLYCVATLLGTHVIYVLASNIVDRTIKEPLGTTSR